MCHIGDIKPGAVMHDQATHHLYEVEGKLNNVVRLIDVAGDIDRPSITRLLVPQALQRLELVRAAPCVEDLASVSEFGPLG